MSRRLRIAQRFIAGIDLTVTISSEEGRLKEEPRWDLAVPPGLDEVLRNSDPSDKSLGYSQMPFLGKFSPLVGVSNE